MESGPLHRATALVHEARLPPLCAELCWLVRAAHAKGPGYASPLSLGGGRGDAEEQRGKDKWGQQQQGQKRVAASQTTAEEEDGDAEEAAEEDAKDGLFQNSQRRLGCRFRCR